MSSANEFFNTAGSNRNRMVVCADGFKMSVQAHVGAYCSPRINGADRYEEVEVGFPSHVEDLIMDYAEEPDSPTQTGVRIRACSSGNYGINKARRHC